MAGYIPAEYSDSIAQIVNADGTVQFYRENFNATSAVATFHLSRARGYNLGVG